MINIFFVRKNTIRNLNLIHLQYSNTGLIVLYLNKIIINLL